MGFCSLQHSRVRRSTCRRHCLSLLRCAFRVWLPSGRLTLSEPLPVLFHTGGALGIRPSELPPPGRLPPRFRDSRTHVPFLPSVIPPPKRWAGPTGRGFWASTLPRVPGFRHSVSEPKTGCSLGFHPPRVFRLKSGPGFRQDSSHALSERESYDHRQAAPRSINRLQLGSFRPSGKPDGWRKQPLQGSCTKTDLSVREEKSPGL